MRPPRLARRWLAWVTPAHVRQSFIDDIEEAFAGIAADRGAGAARLWYWKQVVAGTPKLLAMRLGGVPRIRAGHAAAALARDARLAARTLTRTPGFTLSAIFTFALGIGVNIAVLSVVDRMMFRPLPYGDAGRLVHIYSLRRGGATPASQLPVTVSTFLKGHAQSFDDIAFAEGNMPSLTIPGSDARLSLDSASFNLLRVLRVAPIAGRDFTKDEARLWTRVILLTDEAWRIRFGRLPDVFSRTFGNGRAAARVVGILPPGFLIPSSALTEHSDGVLLSGQLLEGPPSPGELGPSVVARLRPGVRVEQAQAEVDALVVRLAQENPATSAGLRASVTVQPLRSGLFFLYRPYVWLIETGVSAVFLLACVNLAMLCLARGRWREQDAAIRSALGASRAQLVRATMIEVTLLCTISSVLATIVWSWTFSSAITLLPAGLRGLTVSPLDVRLLVLTVAAALAAALISGGLPAWRAANVDVIQGLRRETRSTAGRLRGGATLLAVEAALGVLLVAGAATTVRSFLGVVLKSPGYDVTDLYEARVQHGFTSDRPAYAPDRVRGIVDVVRTMPGVESAAATSSLVVSYGQNATHAFWKARGVSGDRPAVGSGFFQTLRTPILAGREFTDLDLESDAQVAIVNQSGAGRLWPGEPFGSLIGRTIADAAGDRVLVGVVADLRSRPGDMPAPSLFVPLTPAADAVSSAIIVAVRVAPGRTPDSKLLRARLDERFGPQYSLVDSVSNTIAPYLQRPRFQAVLFGAVAVIGLLLAAAGLYAVAAFDMARRRFEIGVRMSLGATAADVRRLVIRGALRPLAVGTGAGLVISWWAAQYLQAFVFEVDARDPATFAFVVCVLVATGVVAAWIPARRAARTDPATVLRAT